MGHYLRKGLHFADLGQHIIILDAPASRYFAMPSAWNDPFRAAISDQADNIDASALEQLYCARLLESSHDRSASVAPIIPSQPLRSLLDGPAVATSSILTAQAVFAQWRAKRDLRRTGLPAIFEELSSSEQLIQAGCVSDKRVALRLGWAFVRSGAIMTTADNCLVRSLALVRMLRSRKILSRLVLGVTASPFTAHAWVQYGDLVLNDRIERVRTFSPIVEI